MGGWLGEKPIRRSGLKNRMAQTSLVAKQGTILVNAGQGPNEKTQPIPWTEHPTDALVSAGSLSPNDNSCAN